MTLHNDKELFIKAIKETENKLVAALDKFDSVGFLDSYFPETDFFVEFERFDRHLEKQRRIGKKIDYVSICSPNYLHDAHVRFALRIGADAICEKPLVLNPWNVRALEEIEKETGRKINTILQLRLHPEIKKLKKAVEGASKNKVFDVDLTYITARGRWYQYSWKGDEHKSGGIANNIGIHFFDMLTWIFGPVEESIVHLLEKKRAAGFLKLERANVRWLLSLNCHDLPHSVAEGQPSTYRSVTVDGREVEFSVGFTDLHTESYRQILEGRGFDINTVLPSIEIVSDIRNSRPAGLKGNYHPVLANINGGA